MKNKQGLALAFAIAFGLASIPNMVTINAEEAQVSTSNGGETIPVDAQHFPDSEFLRYVKHNYMDENGNLSEKAVNEDDLVLNTFTTGSIHVDVKDLEGVAYFPNIERITYVNSKTFQTVDLSKNTNLTCIVFYNDKIDSIKFADNNRIVTLNLYQNELKGLDVSNFKNLETLIIAENPLLYLNVGEQTINFLRYEKNKPVDIVTTDGTIDLEKEAPGITASKIKYTSKDGVKLDGTKFSGVTKDMVIHYDYQITENDVLPVTINVIYKALPIIVKIIDLVIILAFLFTGFLSSTCFLTGSRPKASAGGPSIIILTHSNCIVVKGISWPTTCEIIATKNAIILTVSWN